MDTIPELRAILRDCHTLAVVGLSAEWHRPSFFAAKYLQSHGYRIVPVNPRYVASGADILGQRCYAELADITFPVDMVVVFRRTEGVLPIAQEAVRIGARCLHTVMDRCVKIEPARLFGGLHWIGVNTRVISARRPV